MATTCGAPLSDAWRRTVPASSDSSAPGCWARSWSARATLSKRGRCSPAWTRHCSNPVALAEATLSRYRASVDQGAVTRQALDEAREGARGSRAAVELARARVASVDLDLSKSELRAPFDGVVIRRRVDEGRVLEAGSPVLELQERAMPEIRVGVAGPLADALTTGASYRISWRGRTISAELRALLPVRALGTRTLDALFVPAEPSPDLRPGDLVGLELSEPVAEPGFWLPLSALAEGERGLWQAYALEPLEPGVERAADHRVRPRPVEILYQEGDRVFVQGAIGAGDRVVRGGLHRVVPGQQLVRVPGGGTERYLLGSR